MLKSSNVNRAHRNWKSKQKEDILADISQGPVHPSHKETWKLRDKIAQIDSTFLTRQNYPFSQNDSMAYVDKMQQFWDLAVETGNKITSRNTFVYKYSLKGNLTCVEYT